MDEALEGRAREMWQEDTAGLAMGALVTWETLGSDWLGERIRWEYRAAALREASRGWNDSPALSQIRE